MDDDWRAKESAFFTRTWQITRPERFNRAGESYFSPDGRWVIFQGTENPAFARSNAESPAAKPAAEPDPFYGMYVMLADDPASIASREVEPVMARISPPGSANTCGWFHPTQPGRVLFGSTRVKPADEQTPGFQVGSRRYRWAFPKEMRVVTGMIGAIAQEGSAKSPGVLSLDAEPELLFTPPAEGYAAECSWDPTGQMVLYTLVDPARQPTGDAKAAGKTWTDLYIWDSATNLHHRLTDAPGYNGGPFFSPDGKAICFRADRAGNDLLQLYVAKLKFVREADGTVARIGLEKEFALTANAHVNWAPFFHPSGTYLVYASSEASHANYEVFALPVDWAALERGAKPESIPHVRLTFAPGADVLPAFNADGTRMIWTSQRGPKLEGQERPTSQVWIAELTEAMASAEALLRAAGR
jgi:Tol biopolymer transport system component